MIHESSISHAVDDNSDDPSLDCMIAIKRCMQ